MCKTWSVKRKVTCHVFTFHEKTLACFDKGIVVVL